MPDRKNALMVQAVLAFAQGCGGASVDENAAAWFHQEYYPWIDKPKRSTGKSPMDVWDTHGKDFLVKFRQIGQKAAEAGTVITVDVLNQSATLIENESDCPYCPLKA